MFTQPLCHCLEQIKSYLDGADEVRSQWHIRRCSKNTSVTNRTFQMLFSSNVGLERSAKLRMTRDTRDTCQLGFTLKGLFVFSIYDQIVVIIMLIYYCYIIHTYILLLSTMFNIQY